MTKAEATEVIRSLLDDPQSKRWSATVLDWITTMVMDEIWGELLDINGWLTSELQDAITPTSPGYVDTRLVADGGQLSQRVFRVQSVVRAGQTYGQANARDQMMEGGAEVSSDQATYAHLGNELYLFPLDATTTVSLRYSFLPMRFSDLAADQVVAWPDGYDAAYINEAVGRMLPKGGAEDPTAFLALAAASQNRLKAAIRNGSVGPITMWAADDNLSWGSVY